ncbi:MAG TPA: hypothetical protein VFZ34_27735 [Blastocatellia bacterium]|nr:hypothetical protein [Blastocatellia bacterium]
MGVDELYYHHRRRLPRWERIGHPLDTATVVLCYAWILWVAPTSTTVSIYLGLSLFSCFFVTKDEWVHHQCCAAGEHWLHAVQFILHPLTLLGAGLLWPALHQQTLSFLSYEGFERTFFLGNFWLTLLFGGYQFVYWNILWRPASTK